MAMSVGFLTRCRSTHLTGVNLTSLTGTPLLDGPPLQILLELQASDNHLGSATDLTGDAGAVGRIMMDAGGSGEGDAGAVGRIMMDAGGSGEGGRLLIAWNGRCVTDTSASC